MPRYPSPVVLLHEHPDHSGGIELQMSGDGGMQCGVCGRSIEGVGMIERRIDSYTLIERVGDE